MRKVPAKHTKWLHDELPLLEKDGVLSDEAVDRLKTYYSENTQSGLHWAIVAFSIFSALLIGAGIILLFAHNWDFLSRPARAVISFLPLIVGLLLSGLAVFKRPTTALTEASGIFNSLAVGASIALIGQTYHLPSDTPAFLLSWALLILPLIFLLRSTLTLLVYSALIFSWAAVAQDAYGHAAGFWVLLAPAIIHVAGRIRHERNAPATLFCIWTLLFTTAMGIGFTFERTVPGLWIIAYSAFLGTVALLGRRIYGEQTGWSNPLASFGTMGVVVLTYVFTWTDLWDEVGWHYTRSGWNHKPWGIWFDGTFTFLLVVGWAIAALRSLRQRTFENVTLALFPLIAAVCFTITTVAQDNMDLLNSLTFNGFMLLLGIIYIAQGCKEITLRKLNGGMTILAVLFVSRFFDMEFDFLARGLAFILLGACFLSANLIMIRRKKHLEVAR